MRKISGLLSTLIWLGLSATASAQAVNTPTLEQRIKSAKESGFDSRTLILARAEYEAMLQDADTSGLDEEMNLQRRDLQLSAPSDSPHATSVLEKPGVADILSLALDRGAIKKTEDGTGLTLSTTPYALWTAFGGRDTPQRWNRATIARNLSLSGTFSSSDVTSGDFSSFTSGQLKYEFIGKRSARDTKLLQGLRKTMRAEFKIADEKFDQACAPLIPFLADEMEAMNKWLIGRNASTDTIRAELYQRVSKWDVDAEDLKKCEEEVIVGEKNINASLKDIKTATQNYLEAKRNQLSLATLFVRDPAISDYYAAKLLYGHDWTNVTVNLNGEASWNKNSENPAGEAIRSLRAYSLELGLNRKMLANSRLDWTISTKASRENEKDAKKVVIGEGKLNVHFTSVLTLPISLTYANRETATIRDGWQFNLGLNAFLDGVMRRLAQPQQ